MYQPPHFREERLDVLQALVRAHPLATLVTGGEPGLLANLIPFVLTAEAGAPGVLRAHLAKANEQIRALRDAAEALVIFQGPASYVTPSWYPSKQEHGKVVPTWNYVVVQVRGRPQVVDDAAWLRQQIEVLTVAREQGRPTPWHVDDAPDAFVRAQIKGIVGVEIPIERIEGKWKVSQNRSATDRDGVRRGLEAEGGASEMATLVAAART